MMKKLTFLNPSRENLNLFILAGIVLFGLGILDTVLNSLFEINITSFLPRWLNYFTPLLFSFIGLHYIRIEFSGITKLDQLNKNINSNWFNAILSLLVIFILIKTIPGLLNWLFFDANFIGTTKEECTGDGACWLFIRFWITRFMYGLYPDAEIWRINAAFLMLIQKLKNILLFFYYLFFRL